MDHAGGQPLHRRPKVASTAGLDMRTCWTPTKDRHLARRQSAGPRRRARRCESQCRQAHRQCEKGGQGGDAELLLDSKGWLRAMLHVPVTTYSTDSTDADTLIGPPILLVAE